MPPTPTANHAYLPAPLAPQEALVIVVLGPYIFMAICALQLALLEPSLTPTLTSAFPALPLAANALFQAPTALNASHPSWST